LDGGSVHKYGTSDAYEPVAAIFAIIAAASVSLPFLESGTVKPDETFGRIVSIVFYVIIASSLIIAMLVMTKADLCQDQQKGGTDRKHPFNKGSMRFMRTMIVASIIIVSTVGILGVFGALPNQRQEYFERPLRIADAKLHTFRDPVAQGAVATAPFSSKVEFPDGIPKTPLLIGRLDETLFEQCKIAYCKVYKRKTNDPNAKPEETFETVESIWPAIANTDEQLRQVKVEATGVETRGEFKSEWYLLLRSNATWKPNKVVEYINQHKESAISVTLVSRKE